MYNMNASRITTTLRRVATLHNHLHSQTLRPHIDLLEDTITEYPNNYSMEMHVDHDARTVHFRTKMMSLYERLSVFIKQKHEMRNVYPDYLFTEKHS